MKSKVKSVIEDGNRGDSEVDLRMILAGRELGDTVRWDTYLILESFEGVAMQSFLEYFPSFSLAQTKRYNYNA